jgi:hypothetical protein
MSSRNKVSPPRAKELRAEFEKTSTLAPGQVLKFAGAGDNDVYNISSPFMIGGRTVLTGRVEKREAWADSHLMFFEDKDGVWTAVEGAPVLQLEDGFWARLGEEIVVGGVEVWRTPMRKFPDALEYRTVFFRGRDLASLERFAEGPNHMKDIRLVQLLNGRIGVMTRPQGVIGGRGRIGYLEIDRLEDLTPECITAAPLIKGQFYLKEWGGVNQLHQLPDGRLGALGHIAHMDAKSGRHYHAVTFIFDPATRAATPLKVLAVRKNFPAGPVKTDKLVDVVFSGGLVRHGDGTATLYAGLSDVEAGKILVSDPFLNQ